MDNNMNSKTKRSRIQSYFKLVYDSMQMEGIWKKQCCNQGSP